MADYLFCLCSASWLGVVRGIATWRLGEAELQFKMKKVLGRCLLSRLFASWWKWKKMNKKEIGLYVILIFVFLFKNLAHALILLSQTHEGHKAKQNVSRFSSSHFHWWNSSIIFWRVCNDSSFYGTFNEAKRARVPWELVTQSSWKSACKPSFFSTYKNRCFMPRHFTGRRRQNECMGNLSMIQNVSWQHSETPWERQCSLWKAVRLPIKHKLLTANGYSDNFPLDKQSPATDNARATSPLIICSWTGICEHQYINVSPLSRKRSWVVSDLPMVTMKFGLHCIPNDLQWNLSVFPSCSFFHPHWSIIKVLIFKLLLFIWEDAKLSWLFKLEDIFPFLHID